MSKPRTPLVEPPSYSHVTIFSADGITKIGVISQAELQARKEPKKRPAPQLATRGPEYPTVRARRREDRSGYRRSTRSGGVTAEERGL